MEDGTPPKIHLDNRVHTVSRAGSPRRGVGRQRLLAGLPFLSPLRPSIPARPANENRIF